MRTASCAACTFRSWTGMGIRLDHFGDATTRLGVVERWIRFEGGGFTIMRAL